ncbi:hypothetical protein PFICI_12638 [Pestalotiopsis fici W106-1]|uniref:Uncharacterized protein n=1 Tax=Pestalotiopsis fici (strain W106-1 / CGMCC3.15140) TaxID=1229662 RepID=W3WPF8_PESFW|nr:uncharacterized protein PFICI_12638 [Pestalotiopsis fici W106-1]ETS75694.1 hypothetical protein PFICI_12638 [Pestalotiopsis fici W106-1]
MATEQNAWPPGVSGSVVFDFDVAISEIRNKLSPTFLERGWAATLFKAAKECKNELSKSITIEISTLYVQVTFLDILWERLFGAANGSSPWKMIRRKINYKTRFGEGDKVTKKSNFDGLSIEAAAGEERLFKALCGGFDGRPRNSKTSISKPELFGHFFNGAIGSTAPENDV